MKQQMDNVANAQVTQAISDYNSHFKTTVANEDQMNADNIIRVKNYYANLQQCKPGTYQYAMPVVMVGFAFPTSIIQGLQNNKCIVNTAYDMPQVG